MTQRLKEAFEQIAGLSDERQDEVAQILVALASSDISPSRLTDAQLADVRLARSEAREGKFATENEMADFWKELDK